MLPVFANIIHYYLLIQCLAFIPPSSGPALKISAQPARALNDSLFVFGMTDLVSMDSSCAEVNIRLYQRNIRSGQQYLLYSGHFYMNTDNTQKGCSKYGPVNDLDNPISLYASYNEDAVVKKAVDDALDRFRKSLSRPALIETVEPEISIASVSHDRLTLEFQDPGTKWLSYKLYTANGTLIEAGGNRPSLHGAHHVPLNGLKTGLYFIVVYESGTSTTLKFVR